MPVNHVSLPTGPSNFKRMREFYLTTLQPIGYKIYKEHDAHFCGMQPALAGPDFWLHCGGEDFVPVDPELSAEENLRTCGRVHVAFDASSRRQVDEWYQNAIKAGGVPNGPPGERSYAKGYYAAFVLDPLGNNIEVVHFNPWWLRALKGAPGFVGIAIGTVVSQVLLGYAKKSVWW
ncbi:Glyoxalase/Bleomycin resistance protein/Dihydroxybiphenyl dioxygenase [Podospora australis]|uniref:Glyoxalase/Bleomycin resistance protein/Dihydroxybiphenyl dioxygenase n=1 Tax=Podospora australis TaxID=1536484 RepID=A0AAN6WK40_9PEZI|nr:Glyoxalase/Bleomycin resistance protein/Dihydroxybiphenyl dioxygenase [Podospora australis]